MTNHDSELLQSVLVEMEEIKNMLKNIMMSHDSASTQSINTKMIAYGIGSPTASIMAIESLFSVVIC